MGLFDKNVTRSRGGLFSSQNSPYNVDIVNRQIENASARIRDAGYQPIDADKRNWFEKATNLPENQNFLFDVLEILGRPGAGVVNAINEGVQGGDILSGAWRGFSGQDRTRGADLVENLGVENGPAKFLLGLGTDIITDPLTYVPGGVIAKGLGKAAGAAGNAANLALDAVERAAPGFGQIRQGAADLAQRSKDALGYSFVPDYKLGEDLYGRADDTVKNLKQETENRIGFMTDESMKNVADAAKLGGGIDTGTDVGRIMEKDLKVNFDTDELLKDIWNGQRVTLQTNSGSINDFISKINEKIINNKEIQLRTKQKENQLSTLDKRIKDIEVITKRGPKNKSEANLIDKYDDLLERRDKLADDLDALRTGITIRQMDNGRFVLSHPKSYILKEAIEDPIPLIKEVSPRVTFDEIVDETLKPSTRPIAEKLLTEGKVKVSNIKGTEIEKELRRIFDNKLRFNHGKNTTITLLDKPGTIDEARFVKPIRDVEVERIQRQSSSDPKIQQAAQNLMNSNTELRQWAIDNDIPIGEIEGYMTHVLSRAEREARNKVNAMPIDRGNFGTGQPNKKILNERKLQGSVEDINEQMGREFFEPNAYFSTAIGQKRLIEYANAVKFRREVLSNPNFAQKYEKGMEVPRNAVVIDTNNYKFLADDAGDLANEVGGQYVVTKSVKQALDRYKTLTSDEGINSFLKAFDTVQSFWKRGTLFSVPYHLRNIAGAMFNNYVGGMNTASLVKYTKEAYPVVFNAYIKGKESPMFREFREQGLGSTGQLQIEFTRRGENIEDSIQRTIEKRSKQDGTVGTRVKTELADLKNPLNAFETSRQFGDFNDQAMRFALYKWARDKGMSPEKAAEKVREVQFDYSRTTPFEREVLTRVAPFYRWIRNNLPFQIRQFINDPRKYANVNKIRLNAQEAAGIDDENVPDWMKENFAVPVTGAEDGKGRFLGLNLPVGDLTKISDPLKMVTDSITPLAKLPLELAQNRSFFTEKPIEKFEGQERKFALPENIYGLPIPGGGTQLGGIDQTLAYVLEQLGGQPVRAVMNTFQSPDASDQERKFLAPGLGISSLFKEYDVNKAKYFQQREELQKLLDLINYIEQQTGQPVRTLAEINR